MQLNVKLIHFKKCAKEWIKTIRNCVF